MRDVKKNPFAAALSQGDETLTIFSGGSCLKVWGANKDLQESWDWFERGLESADHCKIALAAVYDIRKAAGMLAAFYPDAADARTVSERVKASTGAI